MNKVKNVYIIENRKKVQRTDTYVPLPPPNPSVNLSPSTDSPMLTTLIVNCQSLLAKRESFLNLINTFTPDVIFGSESWLKSDISSSKIFPAEYSVYCCDCADGYGGVFNAFQESLVSCSLEIDNNLCELVAKLFDNSNLVACSVYHPPSSSDDYLYNLCQH